MPEPTLLTTHSDKSIAARTSTQLSIKLPKWLQWDAPNFPRHQNAPSPSMITIKI